MTAPDLTLIETDRLWLTGWRPEQLPDLERLHGDPLVARYLTVHGQPWTRDAMEKAVAHWIDLFNSRRMGKLRAIRKADGVMVGRAGFGVYGPEETPEIGYSFYPEHWGQGYATEAATALRDWYFRETDRPYFIGLADVRNAASLHVLEKIGGVFDGDRISTEGQLCRFYMYARPQ